MGVFSLTFFGLMPVGALGIGVTAHHFGEPVAVGISAAALLTVACLVWLFAPAIRASP